MRAYKKLLALKCRKAKHSHGMGDCVQLSSAVLYQAGTFMLCSPWSNVLDLYDADHQELQLCLHYILQFGAHVHISSTILIQQEWFQLRHSSVSTLVARTMQISASASGSR
jgi:hypothetical protein